MELTTQQVILKPGTANAKYALAAANITTVGPTAARPLGSFAANVNADAKLSWRMVYDAKQVYSCFQSSGYTSTIYSLFCAETQAECVDKAKTLGLTIPPDALNPEGQ